MSAFLGRIRQLSQKQLMLLALELNEKLEKSRKGEPIAVIGMACRFPGGANTPQAYWKLLREGQDATREVPADRWDMDAFYDPDPDALGKIATRRGGYLDDIAHFDAGLFGIAPREALSMDPQQRLTLETAWEALERAGVAAEQLAGVDVGVFVGLCNSDYHLRLTKRGLEAIDTYWASGNALSVAAGRISYCLGLTGPALTVDTSCSSSLVALHLACKSLRAGEAKLALAGGANVICAPETAIALSRGRMLAPDGRCKTFDAAADGFARGEGCGVLVLKRLSEARADNDNILAVVRGSAINQDGRSGGLTVPSGPAQEAVIASALADAGLSPADIDYVEAHGTGTSLGDPIEVRALGAAYGRDRDRTLLIGSVKTNFGHLESAAGIAGVIKTILALNAAELPASLNFSTPNPHIPWEEIPIEVVTSTRKWLERGRPRRAGVSSFGFSGTNAHVLIEEPPLPLEQPPKGVERPLHVLPVSAQSDTALRKVAGGYANAIEGAALADFAHTAGVGRTHFAERAAVVAATSAEAASALRALSRNEFHPAVHYGRAPLGRHLDVVFMFSGQGGQSPGIARELYQSAPMFRAEIDRCAEILGSGDDGRTLQDVLFAAEDDGAIHDTIWTQPAVFALQHALVTLWASWGVRPAAVIGHSLGEYAAATAAGVFSLEDGLRLVAARGRICAKLPSGAMATIYAPHAEVEELVAPRADELAVAAINGPDSVVISGERGAVDEVTAAFAARSKNAKTLNISMPAHSPLVASGLDEMEAAAARALARAPRIPVCWNLTGGAALPGDGAPTPDYWRRHMRNAVQFADGLSMLRREGFTAFLEIGPHPTLTALSQALLPEDAVVVRSLRRGGDDWAEISSALARLYSAGASVDWAGVDAPYSRRRIDLPTYPFERRHYWLDAGTRPATRVPVSAGLAGTRLDVPGTQREVRLAPYSPAYLRDHLVSGRVIAPGPLFLEMAQACATAELQAPSRVIKAFEIYAPLVVHEEGTVTHVALDRDGFVIHARQDSGWTQCASGKWGAAETGERADMAAFQRRLEEFASCDDYYAALAAKGVVFGPALQVFKRVWRGEGEALASIEIAEPAAKDAAFGYPPALNAALRTIDLALAQRDFYLLGGVSCVALKSSLPSKFYAHAKLKRGGSEDLERYADVELYDEQGEWLGLMAGVWMRRAGTADDLCYRINWVEAPIDRGASESLASPSNYLAGAADCFRALAAEMNLALHDELAPGLDRLAVQHAANALQTLGFDDAPGRCFALDAEVERLGISLRQRRTFEKLATMLVEDGFWAREGAQLVALHRLPMDAADPLYDDLIPRFDPASGELRLLRRCGGALANALTGRIDAAAVLFPDGSFDDARRLYDEAPSAKTFNGTLAEVLKLAVANLPQDAKLRVIEIGAGTGATTARVLEKLPRDRLHYTFTDVSSLFLARAKERFADVPAMRYALLDIEHDPASQGFSPRSFDIVIAANVLHATKDLRRTVQRARSLLAPGGWLALIEGVCDERWIEFTFGLTDGWRLHQDAPLRKTSPLISREAWSALLAEEGFHDICLLPDQPGPMRAARQQAILLARAPEWGRRWHVLAPHGDPLAAAVETALRARGDDIADNATNGVNLIILGGTALAGKVRDDATAAADAESAFGATLESLAEFARCGTGKAYVVTQGAMTVEGECAPGARWQAPLWGLGRVFSLEHPQCWGGLVDLAPSEDAAVAAKSLVAALDDVSMEEQTALRGGKRFAARLVRSEAPPPGLPPIRSDKTYLITGGFGGLGILVGQWLARQGARHIALMGRTIPENQEGARAIEAVGARVYPIACDVADEAALTSALSRLEQQAPPLSGVVHAAAHLGTAPIVSLTREQAAAMLRPKLHGTLAIERVAAGTNLDFVVLFSSIAAILGAAGFALYAGANAFLDATAESAPQGKREVAINWGSWQSMRLASHALKQSFLQAGLEPMSAEEALDLMGRAIADGQGRAVFARIDWARYKPLHEARRARPLLSCVSLPAAQSSERSADKGGLLGQLQAAGPQSREEMMIDFVAGEVAAVLGTSTDALPSLDMGLFDMGMDSLMSVELKRRLERGIGKPLPATLAFNYPNIRALTGYLLSQIAGESTRVPARDQAAPKLKPVVTLSVQGLDLSDDEVERRLRALIDSGATDG